MIIIYLKIIYNIFYMLRISKNTYRVVRNINQSDDSSILLEFYRWLCHSKTLVAYFRAKFKFAGVFWLLEWSSCEKLCLVGKINQYASEWQQGCLNVWFFNIFFKPETEVVVAWICWSLHPLLVYMVYRPRDLYESDSSPCEHYLACQDKDRTWFGLTNLKPHLYYWW
jgi:hypothetical protein